jgi:hypothetical protein
LSFDGKRRNEEEKNNANLEKSWQFNIEAASGLAGRFCWETFSLQLLNLILRQVLIGININRAFV